jgi:hypothetical protein
MPLIHKKASAAMPTTAFLFLVTILPIIHFATGEDLSQSD